MAGFLDDGTGYSRPSITLLPFRDDGQQSALRQATPEALTEALDCAIVGCDREVVMAKIKLESVFDVKPDAAFEARLDAEAEADVAAGQVISHESVCEWLTKLAKGERVPPPPV
jgi:hypothetical protein